MTSRCCLAVIPLIALAVALWPTRSPRAADTAAEWKMVWSDEFAGTEIDKAKWDYDTGNGFFDYGTNTWIGGWGNSELQYYTKEADNAFVKDGMLHIKAIKESYLGCGYTSARLKTRKKDGGELFNKLYGKFEFRAKLPTGKGVWPAIWMLPQKETYGTWPSSGEIDIMEARGQEPTKVLSTLHFGSKWPANTHIPKDYVLPKGGTIADFHTYTMEWEPGEMRFFVDDLPSATHSFWWSSGKTDGTKGANPTQESDLNPWPAPFDHPFYIVLNVAVGGKFLGNPDKNTVFPAEMVVDYVRVYDKVGGPGRAKPRGEGKLPFGKP
ncbi:glycoside hydrolase family 16 protein [Limnoglobus roseus]|uniref:Retaining glycoside hydrolase n=1 Tax=Limnoglobus roseus TaxID=2598579 RepID=A0A5C1ALD8_9BACT|nr:glycoside hydrolase family 16 protein [Limnoglobus roseus]QEL18004.1 retaining glycoside hydrolase [Limnoglobus roseus]